MSQAELIALREYIEYHKVTAPPVLRAADSLVALQAENARLAAELASIADATEPHWRGAGLEAKADWIINEWLSRVSTRDDEIERLEAELEEWRFTNKIDELQRCNERLDAELASIRKQKPVVIFGGRRGTPEETSEIWGNLVDHAALGGKKPLYAELEYGQPLYASPVQPAQAQPCRDAACQARPPAVEDNSQHWAGMDGAIAFQLIERHADNWADTGKMMGEWLAANQQPVQARELSDAEIENLAKAHGARWTGSVWEFEDADLHPFARAVIAAYKGAK